MVGERYYTGQDQREKESGKKAHFLVKELGRLVHLQLTYLELLCIEFAVPC